MTAPIPSDDSFGRARVLLVGPAPEHPAWVRHGDAFEVRVAVDVAEAAGVASGPPVDVVVLDADAAGTDAGDVARLLERCGHPALLLQTSRYGEELEALMERLGAACLVPPDAPPSVQAAVVTLAARHARAAAENSARRTESAEQVRELERSRGRFRDVIEHVADALVVTDREGVIRFANTMAERLFAAPRQTLVGSPFGFPLVAGENVELDLPRGGDPRVAEMRVVESEWEGETAFIASLRDITARKHAEEAARSLIREQAARASAEAAARRFRFVAEATTLLSQPLEYTETLATLARICVPEMADWAVVFEVDERGGVRRVEIAHIDPGKAGAARELLEHPLSVEDCHPVLAVLRSGTPLLATSVDDERLRALTTGERHRELTRELGVSSLMLVPLVAREHQLGAVALVSSSPERRFAQADLELALDLARRAALAVDNARLYRAAREANQAKSNLVAVISHDLRTPLNSIMGHADLLAMGIPDALSAASLERVGRIRTGASHLLYLIDELLSFARLESGHDEVRLQEVDAAAVAGEVAAVMEPLAMERGLAFRTELAPGVPALTTDPDRLRQVLLNLVGNAVKYTERGEVRLVLRAGRAGGAEFAVRDTGVGIRPEHLETIFEPFWQVDPTQRARSEGTGLGLSVVRGLLQLLGGEIRVESEVGSGSTFTVTLPARGGRPGG